MLVQSPQTGWPPQEYNSYWENKTQTQNQSQQNQTPNSQNQPPVAQTKQPALPAPK